MESTSVRPSLWWSTQRLSTQLLTWILLATAVSYCAVSWGRRQNGVSADSPRSQRPNQWPDRLLMNSENACNGQDIEFVTIVHSRPEHFRQRQVIRQTWTSTNLTRTVFLIGRTDRSDRPIRPPDVGRLLQAEQSKYGDLVQGDFIDDYRNLTLKNLMGLRWVSTYCLNARYVLKSDDDAFVDVHQLRTLLRRTFDQPPDDTIVCNVQPEGTPVQRQGKWAVSPDEYSSDSYPTFCSGLAYVLTPRLAGRLIRAADRVPFFWIDDVYVTGLLVRHVVARHFYLNLRYTHRTDDLYQWLDDSQQRPFPYIVAEFDTDSAAISTADRMPDDWRPLVERLWNKTRYVSSHFPH